MKIIKIFWIHLGIMLLLSVLFAFLMTGTHILTGQGVMLWFLCFVAFWLYIGSPVGVWGSIVAVVVGVFALPLSLARLAATSKKMLWVSIVINITIMTLSFFAARNMINSGLFM